MIAAIERLLEPDTAGDPIRGLRWTHRTTAKIAAQLLRLRIRVSARTVARLLRKLRFRLRVNRKKIGPSHPLREVQFAGFRRNAQGFHEFPRLLPTYWKQASRSYLDFSSCVREKSRRQRPGQFVQPCECMPAALCWGTSVSYGTISHAALAAAYAS